jgi:hypothetical protein
MPLLSFKIDHLFILLVPELVVFFVGECAVVNFPSEPDFVQKHLSIWSHCVIVMKAPLTTNPLPQRFILLVFVWNHTIALFSFIFDQLFIVLVPELVDMVSVVGAVIFPSEPDFVKNYFSVWSHFVIGVSYPLLHNPLP